MVSTSIYIRSDIHNVKGVAYVAHANKILVNPFCNTISFEWLFNSNMVDTEVTAIKEEVKEYLDTVECGTYRETNWNSNNEVIDQTETEFISI